MYWKLKPGRERDAARAKWEQDHPPRAAIKRGPRPYEITKTDSAIIVRGTRYEFADHGGTVLAGMLANANCPPLPPGLPIEVTADAIRVAGFDFRRGVPAVLTRTTREALQRELESQQDAVEGWPSTAS